MLPAGYALAVNVLDTLGRPVRDLRISVTDRCNFRCTYCMPKSVFGRDYKFMPRRELLTFTAVVLVFVVIMMAIVYGLDFVFGWGIAWVFGDGTYVG